MVDPKAAHRAAFFWVPAALAALAAYVAWNDPLQWALTRMLPLGVAFLFLGACCGLGAAAVSAFDRNARRDPDLLISTAYGFGIIAAIVFVCGLGHVLHGVIWLAVITTGDALCVLVLVRAAPTWRLRMPSSGWSIAGWVMIAAFVLLILPFVLAPEISTDAAMYHLLVPKLYLEHGAITHLPLFVESNYPSLAEYDYLPLLLLGGDVAAKSLHFLCAIALLFAIARLARQLQPASDGVLAAALFITMPVAAITAGWAWNDMFFTLFVILAISELLEDRMLSAGVLFGLATWTKYTFVLAAIGIAAVLVRGLVRRRWRVREIVRFALPVAAIATIWVTKNAVMTGNPFYPFLNTIFHSPEWNSASDTYHLGMLRSEIPQWSWSTYLLFPFLMTLKPRLIDVHPGLFPLLLLPLAFVRRGDERTNVVRTYAIAITIGWLFVQTVTRSLFSLFAVLAVLYATALESECAQSAEESTAPDAPHSRRSSLIPTIAAVMIAVGVLFNSIVLIVTTHVGMDPMRYFIGLETRQQYIARVDETSRPYLWLNAQPDVRGVLLVGMHDPLHLDKPVLFSSRSDKPVAQALVEQNGSAAGIAAALRRGGITHVVVRTSQYRRDNVVRLYTWNDAQREVFRNFLATSCRPAAKLGDVIVFALR